MASDAYKRRSFTKGEYVFREGEMALAAYLIESGKVEVFKESDPDDVSLTTLGTGEIVGEMGLIVGGERTASVKALTDCHVIVIDRDTFEKKLDKSDPTVRAMMKMLSQRIVETNKVLADQS